MVTKTAINKYLKQSPSVAQQPLLGQGLPIGEASRSISGTIHDEKLL